MRKIIQDIEPENPLSDSEKEMIYHLRQRGGLKTNEARVLVVLFRGLEYTYKDLAAITGTSRSGMSVGMAGLIKRGYVLRSILIRERDGHPIHLFGLKMPPGEIYADLFHRHEERDTTDPDWWPA